MKRMPKGRIQKGGGLASRQAKIQIILPVTASRLTRLEELAGSILAEVRAFQREAAVQ
jgi:hypothetical protein